MAVQVVQIVLLHSLGYLYLESGLSLPLLPLGQLAHGSEALR
jgi:hypothetical protein